MFFKKRKKKCIFFKKTLFFDFFVNLFLKKNYEVDTTAEIFVINVKTQNEKTFIFFCQNAKNRFFPVFRQKYFGYFQFLETNYRKFIVKNPKNTFRITLKTHVKNGPKMGQKHPLLTPFLAHFWPIFCGHFQHMFLTKIRGNPPMYLIKYRSKKGSKKSQKMRPRVQHVDRLVSGSP